MGKPHTTMDLDCYGVGAHFMAPALRTNGAILLLPSIHGREPYIMDYMRGLVEAGYPTLLWDLFAGQGEAHTKEERAARSASLSDAGSTSEMSKLLTYMSDELKCEKVVAVGFCLGGRYGLALAEHDHRLSGLAAYYPSIETPRHASQEWDVVAEAVRIQCPVHLVTPGNDHLTSGDVFRALQNNLQARSAPTYTQYFPQAEHAFMQERRIGAANEIAREHSRKGVHAFLEAILAPGNTSKAVRADAMREQCWLISAENASPPPKLTVSMKELTTLHHAFIDGLKRDGLLVGAGAFRNEHGVREGTGLIIIRAQTRALAESIASKEPYIAHGVRTLKLVPWQRSAEG